MRSLYASVLCLILCAVSSLQHARPSEANAVPAVSTKGKPAGASSYAPGYPPGSAEAAHASHNEGWRAATGQFPQWLVVDLGFITTIDTVRQDFAAADSWSFKIEGSNDDNADDSYWTTLSDNTAGLSGKDFSLPVTGSFRYVRLYVMASGMNPASSLSFTVKGKRTAQSSATVPRPHPAATGTTLVGAQACNLWANQVDWQTLVGYPDRVSMMGTYNEAYDVATDWQIKMAAEHGISFIQPCWFRLSGNEDSPVVMASYDHFLNSLANFAKYRTMMNFAIDWINDGADSAGASGVPDFETHLVPYWIGTYFSKPNYLTIGGKKVLAIYDFEAFIGQMGGLAQAQAAIQSFRAAVAKAGFAGLILETQQSGSTTPADHWVLPGDPQGVDPKFGNLYTGDTAHINADAAAAGFDYVFAYHVPTFTDLMATPAPTDQQVQSEQIQAWSNWLQYSALPTIVSVSMGWNAAPWGDTVASWKLSPPDWQSLLASAQSAMAARSGGIGASMILLDSWNEYAEGHYIAPTAADGYAYLDAVGAVFVPGWTSPVPIAIDAPPAIQAIPQMLGAGLSRSRWTFSR